MGKKLIIYLNEFNDKRNKVAYNLFQGLYPKLENLCNDINDAEKILILIFDALRTIFQLLETESKKFN